MFAQLVVGGAQSVSASRVCRRLFAQLLRSSLDRTCAVLHRMYSMVEVTSLPSESRYICLLVTVTVTFLDAVTLFHGSYQSA